MNERHLMLILILGELIESLDNTAASLESCLAHFGGEMPEHDRLQREFVLENAKQILAYVR